ncbi:hypothetical protein [Oscillatoria acuminata]|uniref:Uncharacterized protein n=1 Tax=Oscillatoria acuminata PCC 6304 TaxID=56110 RepID=K9TKJ5_9CYAN|nr:hypothetical protein [Oscillatoria acuminata]AFY82671.1 hypothetical protein Oscil6304_3088 [Oscillatoria acuminata PCC 6304]
MADMVEKAQTSIDTPELQEILKKLSEYGLGVFMPHMHDPTTGNFAPLPPGIVSVEDNLQVSFLNASDPKIAQALPVGWIWDNGTQSVMNCVRCIEYSGRHGKSSH